MSQPNTLALPRLAGDVPALTWAVGMTLVEACMVCFEDQKHSSGVELRVFGTYNEVFTVTWEGRVTEQMRRYWRDEEFTTEQAAYGIAILLVEQLTGYTAIQRSDRGPGFDYWIGYYQEGAELPFEHKARLEVSGIRRGSDQRIKARVAEKKRQTDPSNGVYPAYIAVVDFSRPSAWVVLK